MTNEEILNEVRSTFKLEGIEMSPEQEERIAQYLSGEKSFDSLLMGINREYMAKKYMDE